MRPKPPATPNTPKANQPIPGSSRLRPDASVPMIHPPPVDTSTRPAISPDPNQGLRPEDRTEGSRVEVSDLPGIAPESVVELRSYLLNHALLRNMQAANDDGFRFVVGRKFVDIKDVGTVHVEFDATLNAYRVRDLYNRLPPGPLLFKNAADPTWSLLRSGTPQTGTSLKRPLPLDLGDEPSTSAKRTTTQSEPSLQRPAAATVYPLKIQAFSYFRMRLGQSDNEHPTYLYGYDGHHGRVLLDAPPPEYALGPNQHTQWTDLSVYAATGLGPDAQGYYRIPVKPAADSPTPQIIYAFKYTKDLLAKVDPPASGNDAPSYLNGWTDFEIWQRYNLQGADILRFRRDAQTSGTRPSWATPMTMGNARKQLLMDSLRWIYPHMTRKELSTTLRSYNLSPNQHATLLQNLLDNPRAIPDWAEQHKLRTLDTNDPTRFEVMQQEIEPLMVSLRNGIRTMRNMESVDKMVSREFLDAFLSKLGYLRNAEGLLYRTDLPAMFRADERTLFEFVDDGQMFARMSRLAGSISATVGLQMAQTYAGGSSGTPDPHYLRYNHQRNKYPGKAPGEPDNESDASNDWSDTSDIELDHERNYETTRHNQKINFVYVIDTRDLPVVLREENFLLNIGVVKKGVAYPEDDHETLISTTRRGISSERIWLVHSANTHAAKIEDIAGLASYQERSIIQEGTHRGDNNRFRYDNLIDSAAEEGRPILRMDRGLDTFASDIVWPQ